MNHLNVAKGIRVNVRGKLIQVEGSTLEHIIYNLCYFLGDKKVSRTPRRAQQPKTLNTPEDSTYYNLIHVSHQKEDATLKLRCMLPCIPVQINPQLY